MTHRGQLQILIYKRTHNGDPDPDTGVFGNHDCMGQVRGRHYDAVIGIGGVGDEPRRYHIAKKLTWVGIGPHKDHTADGRGPVVTFDHFLYYGDSGPMIENLAPVLASRIYGGKIRSVMSSSLSEKERLEAEAILRMAVNSPPSGKLVGDPQPNFPNLNQRGKSYSGCRKSSDKNARQERSASQLRCR